MVKRTDVDETADLDNWLTFPPLDPVQAANLPSLPNPYLTDSALAAVRAVLEENPLFKDSVEQVMSGLEETRNWYVNHEKAFREVNARINLWVTQLPEKTRHALTMMADDGWFVDDEMPVSFTFHYQKLVDMGQRDEAEKFAAGYFAGRINGVFEDLCARVPKRKAIFEAALAAFRRREHLLAIPVLFSQVDGVCHDIFGGSFFQPGGRKKIARRMSSEAAEVAGDFLAAHLVPFNHPLPVLLSEGDRQEGFFKLNRHQVLHGETVDYGTEENTLRAISLLNHVVQRCCDKPS